MITGIIVGVVVAAIVIFFVWRNNKTQIENEANKLDVKVTDKLSKK